jgi:hypothetical protein
MTTLYDTAQAADELGVSVRSVQRASKRHKIGKQLGVGKPRVFTQADIDRLRPLIPGKAGCPDFTTGNQFWQQRKSRNNPKPKATKDLGRGKTRKRKSA